MRIIIVTLFVGGLIEITYATDLPYEDMSSVAKLKKLDSTKKNGPWEFLVAKGKFNFNYDEGRGIANFTLHDAKKVGNPRIAFIQVARTGSEKKWYVSEAEINALSSNNKNFLLRTDPIYGFRVDRTKGENTPFYEQTTISQSEDLSSYKIGFDIDEASNIKDPSIRSIRFFDRPRPDVSFQRMKNFDVNVEAYQFHFLLSVMNIDTGEILGTLEWGVKFVPDPLPSGRIIVYQPRLVKRDNKDLNGQRLAFIRWNELYPNAYRRENIFSLFKLSPSIYPIPGKDISW